ncbi:MAG: GGDEF domain-containing protein [Oscillospiraceae bacterium]|nr:GGDEF domain-containing protein [Oscillospiraceae bacterium]
MRKCIAVFLAQPEKQYQLGILQGIYNAAFENGYNVAVFATSYPDGKEKNMNGELAIFSVPNLNKLSGVICLSDTLKFDNISMQLEPLYRQSKSNGLPVVTVDYSYEGIPSYICDDTYVIGAMVDHLVKCHGCKDIAYMTGIKGHPHAEHRLMCFRKAMAEHGLTVNEDNLYYGDFWYFEGENFVEKLTCGGRKLPDAIMCANNPMTYSVYTALFDRGYHVPDDVRIAGYDEEFNKLNFISETCRSTEKVGEAACRGLIDLIEGKAVSTVPQRVKCEYQSNFSVTCGCSTTSDYDFTSKKQLWNSNEMGGFFSEFNGMNECMLSQCDFDGVFWEIDAATYYIGEFEDLYFCMNDMWDDPEATLDENEIAKEYTPIMHLHYYHHNNNHRDNHDGYKSKVGIGIDFPLSDMFPLLYDESLPPAAYTFRPLHFTDRCFGYVVISNGQGLFHPDIAFNSWMRNVANALESQQRLQNTMYLYKRMQENAITDLMTGLGNRNSFNIDMHDFLESAAKNNHEVVLILGDLNGLKFINDTYGHLEGDVSIKAAALSVSSNVINGSVKTENYRIGGDEFVKIASGHFTDKDIEEYCDSVRKFLTNYNHNSGKPYPVYISMGVCRRKPNEINGIDELISAADKAMFENKLKVKKETGFDPKRKT